MRRLAAFAMCTCVAFPLHAQDDAPTDPDAPAQDASPAPADPQAAAPEAAGTADQPQEPAPRSARAPVPLVPEGATWDSFHGQLSAQKYSPLTEITAERMRMRIP